MEIDQINWTLYVRLVISYCLANMFVKVFSDLTIHFNANITVQDSKNMIQSFEMKIDFNLYDQ